MRKQILIIGSLNMDLVTDMERIPEIGETVLGKGLSCIPGGKGANQACAAGKMGASAVMLGCVGDDDFGRQQIENLTEAGVDMSRIRISRDTTTGTALICVDKEGNNNIVVVPGANELCTPEYLKENDKLFCDSDYIIFQMEIPLESVHYGIQRGKELGKTVILNPAPAPDFIPDEVLLGLDYITPNETELMKLCTLSTADIGSVREGAAMLLKKGVKNVLVTMGEEGVLFADKDSMQVYPACKVKAVDTTAAGDCFNGSFAAALASGMEKGSAIAFANLASSIAVTHKGAQSSIPRLQEVEAKFAAQENKGG